MCAPTHSGPAQMHPRPFKEQTAGAQADWKTRLQPSFTWLQNPERASALHTYFLRLTDESRAAQQAGMRSVGGHGRSGLLGQDSLA